MRQNRGLGAAGAAGDQCGVGVPRCGCGPTTRRFGVLPDIFVVIVIPTHIFILQD